MTELKCDKRVESLDLIRGVVILAILIININYISTPSVLRYNPLAFGEFTWLDEWIWFFEYSFIKQRFMPILALLFGAGIYFFCRKYEAYEQSPLRPYLKRSMILIAIGLAHGYLIWDGDILVAYAICGVAAFFLRQLATRWLIGIGVLLVVAPLVPEVLGLLPKFSGGIEPPAFWQPDAETIDQLRRAYQGTWLDLTPARIETAIGRQTNDLIYFTLWRCTGLMMIGLAFARCGLFNAEQQNWAGVWVGLGIGIPVSILGTYFYLQSGFDYAYFSTYLTMSFYIGSLSLAYAYLQLLIVWSNSNFLSNTKRILTQAGKMALSLYIMQSFVATFIFHGWGLGLYSFVSRSEVMLITIAILAGQLLFVKWWSKQFSQGPLEALWRTLYQGGRKRVQATAQ